MKIHFSNYFWKIPSLSNARYFLYFSWGMMMNEYEEKCRKISTVSSCYSQCSQASYCADSLQPGVYYPKKKAPRGPRIPVQKIKRVVTKNGEFNIEKSLPKTYNISKWFITMVEARWRWTLINFVTVYTLDWMTFGFIYWVIALVHGDLEEDHLPPRQNISHWTPCVDNIYGFISTLLFSVEVHTTVAYGKRSITLECPAAITAMCLQCVLSSIFQAFMVGILFAKFTRPKARTQTILFSKNAVVNLKDGKLCLVFRVGDIRKSRILNIKAKVYLIRMDKSEYYDFEQIALDTILDGCESTFFLWPLAVMHVIDKSSPLYNISAADLLCGKIEILAAIEGTIETTGQPVQARTSYTNSDISWGYRFARMVEFDFVRNMYNVDFSKLNETEQFDTPLCSAYEYENFVNVLSSSLIDSSGSNEMDNNNDK